jgi:dipeptidyl aminopeptidase/acylaminoacyl peptidase
VPGSHRPTRPRYADPMPTQRPFVPADIRRQAILEEHDVARDGRLAVVGRRTVRRNRYEVHLWVVPLDDGRSRRARRLTSGAFSDRWPRISPDGRSVACVRHPGGADPVTSIQLIGIDRGRARRLRRGAHGDIAELAWSPDGTRLAYTAEVDPPRFLVGPRPPVGTKPRPDEDTPLARRMTRTDWRFDGVGHLDRWAHLFVVDVRPGAHPRQVTAGDWGVTGIAWSPDGRTVAFAADRGPEPDLRPRSTIWAVDVDTPDTEPREVLAPAGYATQPAYSADGRWIAGVGIIEADPLDDVSPGVIVGPSDGSGPAWEAAPDLDRPIGSWVDCDLTGWLVDSRTGPAWVGSDAIVAAVTDRGRSHARAFSVDPAAGQGRGVRMVAEGDVITHSLAVSADGLVTWLGTEGVRGLELATARLADAPSPPMPTRRTTIGTAWQARHPQPVMTLVQAPGSGGPIETWVASPPDAGAARLPTVLDVHGGPLGAWGPAPHTEVALLVARGYRVVLPNIRGSAGFGRGWIRPQLGDWGGVDAADVHAALDHVIGLGLVDPEQLGVLGLSYGGFMVHWLIGTSRRFRAAVSENGVTNQVSDWANSDTGPEYDRVALLGDPFSPAGIDKLWRQSPLAHVSDIDTPLLMFQGEADLRCPPQDNEQLFIALRNLRRTVEYVLYPDEFHVFSSSGRPDRRIDRQTRMLDWFDHYLRA